MIQTVHDIISNLDSYFSDQAFLFLFLAAFLYLFFFEKDLRKPLVFPSILIILVILNPSLYDLVYRKVLLYACWRILWLLPLLPIIATAFSRIIRRIHQPFYKVLMLLLLSSTIVLSGNNLYTVDLGRYARFEKTPNPYKVPQNAVNVSNSLLELSDTPKALVHSSLVSYVRQYSGSIQIMFGRTGCEGNYLGALSLIPSYAESDFPNFLYVHNAMKSSDFQYLVTLEGKVPQEEMSQCGFDKINSIDGYDIYKLMPDADFSKTGWQISHFSSLIDEKISYYMLVNAAGELIVIDSGLPQEAYYFSMMLNQYDGHISAWIITNPAAAENSALQWIIENDFNITIDHVYKVGSNSFDDILAQHSSITLLEEGDKLSIGRDLMLEVHTLPNHTGKTSTNTLDFTLSGKDSSVHFASNFKPEGITVIQ